VLKLLRAALGRGSIALLVWSISAPVLAQTQLQIVRLSDTDALIVGGGTMGSTPAAGWNIHALYLSNPFGNAPGPLDNNYILVSSELRAGSFQFNFAHDAGAGYGNGITNTIYIGRNPFDNIPEFSTLTGTMQVRLYNGVTFAPVGSIGAVYWGTSAPDNGQGAVSGSWTMLSASAVPEAATSALLGFGLLTIALSRLAKRDA
jgi:hypothetical protein